MCLSVREEGVAPGSHPTQWTAAHGDTGGRRRGQGRYATGWGGGKGRKEGGRKGEEGRKEGMEQGERERELENKREKERKRQTDR